MIGKTKQGERISLTLSISPSTCRGEYVGILYGRSQAEARVKAENNLLSLQLDHLKLKIAHDGVSPSLTVQRHGRVVEAWTGEWMDAGETSPVSPSVNMACIVARSDDGIHFTGRLVTKKQHEYRQMGEPVEIRAGCHAFVKVANETFLRLSLHSGAFGQVSGHGMLANEHPVLYAGEMEFDDRANLIRWNNLSGTYHADDDMCFQTGLPLDRFWAVQDSRDECFDEERVHVTASNIVLYRVLACSDDEYNSTLVEYTKTLTEARNSNPKLGESFELMQRLSKERTSAVSKYGYFSTVREKSR